MPAARKARAASLAQSAMPEAMTTILAPAEANFTEASPLTPAVQSIIQPPPTIPTQAAREAKAVAVATTALPTAGPMQSAPWAQATKILFSATSMPAEASASCPTSPPKQPLQPLRLKHHDVICGAFKYTSKQPGNTILNNLVLDRHDEHKIIDPLDQHKKSEYVYQIISEMELSGRFLTRLGPALYKLADEKSKKMTVQRRLRRRGQGQKKPVPPTERETA